MIAIIYMFMLVFDLAVVAGAVWLIGWNGWSPWWMLMAALVMLGSSPSSMIKAWKSTKDEEVTP